MATAARRLIVEIIGDSRSYEQALKRSTAAGQQFNKTFSLNTGTVLKGAVAFGVATTATNALVGALHASVSEYAEQAKVAAQTNAVLKSTGGIANVTAGHVDDLAASISRYSGQDDEAVQAAENLLLTFTHIRNQVGKGNDIFDQATVAVSDLAQAMGIDNTRAALQLGKALNDPIRGYARLQRIGVQFSDAQIKQIKALAASGREMEAQKVILQELTTEFGGSARMFGETVPGKIARAREAFRNLGGELAGAFAQQAGTAAEAVLGLADAIEKARDEAQKSDFLGGLRRSWERLPGPLKAIMKATVLGPFSLGGGGGGGGMPLQGPQGSFFIPPHGVGPQNPPIDLAETTLPFRIRKLQAQGRELAAAREIVQFITPVIQSLTAMIESGKLHGKKLSDARKRLLEATQLQVDAQQTLADAQKTAADKQKAAAQKHADAVKAAAEKQRQAAAEAAAKLAAATDQARSEIGQLFAGPVLAPSEAQRKMRLGVPGPDAAQILADIRAQNAQALRFETDLRKLRQAGVGGATINELRGLGTGSIPQLESILGTSGAERRNLISALIARERTAQRIGQMIVHTPNVTLHARRVVLAGGGGTRTVQSTARSGRNAGVS